jgi:inner membrane protein
VDTLTHLVAGALTPLAFRGAPRTRTLALFGIICGEFPDIDVIAGRSAEALLVIHRGVTHALALQPLSALLLALLFHRLIKKKDANGTWTFAKTWSVALLALLIHLFLDCMTTFGTQIFLPFSDVRVALPAMYIIDFWLTVPLLLVWLLVIRRGSLAPDEARARTARRGLAWLVAYPLIALAINHALASQLTKTYAAPGNERGITRLELSPEPFAPFNWKVVGIAPATYHMGQFFVPHAGRDIRFTPYARADAALWETLRRAVPLFAAYDAFAAYPAQTTKPLADGREYTFRDVRYESTLPELMNALGRSDGLFLMQAKVSPEGRPEAYRFLYRGRDEKTARWEKVDGRAN